jgi:hypothetical protein
MKTVGIAGAYHDHKSPSMSLLPLIAYNKNGKGLKECLKI